MATSADLRLRDWLDAVAGRNAAPGGGAAAAVALSAAGALGTMVARFSSGTLDDADELSSRADRARQRALELAVADEEAVRALYPGRLDAGGHADGADGGEIARERRDADVAGATRRATEIPLEIVETAAALAPLLRRLRRSGNPLLAGDAQVALELADASARGAAALVRANAPALSVREREQVLADLAAAEPQLRDPS